MREVLRAVIPALQLAAGLSVISVSSFATVVYPLVRGSFWRFALGIIRSLTRYVLGPFLVTGISSNLGVDSREAMNFIGQMLWHLFLYLCIIGFAILF